MKNEVTFNPINIKDIPNNMTSIQPVDVKIKKTNPIDHILATQDPGGLVDGGMNSAVLKGIEQTN